MSLKNDLFLRACRKEYTERTPVWVMRQAGRYLPEYRAVREKYDFLTMCKTPDIAAEVTIQPVDLIGVDAAILFSDILVIPEAMGMHLEIEEGKGPILHNPIRHKDQLQSLKTIDPASDLKYVLDAIKVTKAGLQQSVPLIGFSGAPWTLMTYMVEGRGSKNFTKVKELVYTNPLLAHELLTQISTAVADYLLAKIEAGVDAVQIFDTWGGMLAPHEFEEFSLKYIERIVDRISGKVPVIIFAKGANASLKKISKAGADVVGIDWTINIHDARKEIGKRVALQGNLDPTVLYGTPELIVTEVTRVLNDYGEGEGHIFNLGHGMMPDMNPDNLRLLVQTVKEKSLQYHGKQHHKKEKKHKKHV